jgi:hypothetical protein
LIYVQGIKSVESRLDAYKIHNTEAVLSLELALKRLDIGRDTMSVLPKVSSQAIIENSHLQNVIVHEPAIFTEPMYHYLSDKHQNIVTPLCQAIAQILRQQGKLIDEQCMN